MFAAIKERFHDITIVAAKELRHCMRDSHVLIYTVLVPLILYPLSLVGLSEYTLWREGLAETRPLRVVFTGDETKIPELVEAIKKVKKAVIASSKNAERDLESGVIDAVIDGSSAPDKISVVLNPASDRYLESRVMLISLSSEARSDALDKVIEEAGANNKITRVFEIATRNVGTVGGRKANLPNMETMAFSTTIVMVAFFAYSMLIITVGAIYPALSTFTEESEKKTKSTTYLLPVERSSVVLGKFSAVVALTLFCGLINLFSMACVALYFSWKLVWLRRALELIMKHFIAENLIMLVYVFVLSTLMIAAIYSLVGAIAKSFKEAQNVSSLLLIVITLVPMAALIPGWNLDQRTALIPILNMVLACKAISTETMDLGALSLACSEIIILTVLLLYLCQLAFWGKEPSGMGQSERPVSNPV